MREIKFRAWDTRYHIMTRPFSIHKTNFTKCPTWLPLQYTGLKDKNGVEIYELMGIDHLYEVSFLNGSYVLTNISNGDIILLYDYIKGKNGEVEVTSEYTKI